MSTTNTTTRKIVLAYDNSPNSNHALDVCIKQNIFQKGSSDEVIVITVVNEDVSNLYTPLEIQGAAYAGEWIANDYKDRCDSLESEAKAVLTKVIAKLKEQGVRFFALQFLIGYHIPKRCSKQSIFNPF